MLATKLAVCSYILVRAGDDSKSEPQLKRRKLSRFVPHYQISRNAIPLIFATFAMLLLVGCKHIGDAPNMADERRIADACLKLLHSPLANEGDINPTDSRLPQAIRTLHPVDVDISAGMVIITFPLRDGLTEYHLSADKTAGTWILYGAGPQYDNQHRELLRFESK